MIFDTDYVFKILYQGILTLCILLGLLIYIPLNFCLIEGIIHVFKILESFGVYQKRPDFQRLPYYTRQPGG